MGQVNGRRESRASESDSEPPAQVQGAQASAKNGRIPGLFRADQQTERLSAWAMLAEGERRDQKHSPLSSTPERGMLQGSRFECRSGQPGRTLWCLGAPTRTCCGVTQGVKLREQRRRAASLEAERGQGRRGRLKYVKARRARHSEAAKEADRPQPKAMWDGPSDLSLPTATPGCPTGL
jgi:hypothetical protein